MKITAPSLTKPKVSIHSAMNRLCLVSCLMVATISSSSAVIYTSTYSASTLPTATAGTTSDPLWVLGGNSGTYSASASNGILSASTVGDASVQWWALGTQYAGSTMSAWNTSTATIDFNLQVTAASGGNAATGTGFMMQLSDKNSLLYSLYIGTTTATFATSSTTKTEVDLVALGINPTAFNLYRAVIDNGKFSLYVEGRSAPIFSMLSGVNLGVTRNAILFGDGSSAESGTYNLDYINWSNTTAEFLSPVPEPSTMALAGIGGLFAIIFMRRGGLRRP